GWKYESTGSPFSFRGDSSQQPPSSLIRRACQPFSLSIAVSFSCVCQLSRAPETQVARPVACAADGETTAAHKARKKRACMGRLPVGKIQGMLVAAVRRRQAVLPLDTKETG